MNDEWPLTAGGRRPLRRHPDLTLQGDLLASAGWCGWLLCRPACQGDLDGFAAREGVQGQPVIHMYSTMLDPFCGEFRFISPIVMCGGEALTPALRARVPQGV